MKIKANKIVIYKITYPNGKICVGKDLTNSINYFGNTNAAWIARDFDEMQRQSFTVTRDILWTSTDAISEEVNRKEVELIRSFRANDPAIGYNRWPKHLKGKIGSHCRNR